MTIAADSRTDYVGTGLVTEYDWFFLIWDEDDLLVTTADEDGNETTLVLDTDYTVEAGPWPTGGTITLAEPLADGHALTIRRRRSLAQTGDFRSQATLRGDDLELALDKLAAADQQQQDEINRSLKVGDTFSGFDATLPAPVANKVIAFGADGLSLTTASADALVMDAVSTDLLPDVTATRGIGSAIKRWVALYLSGGLFERGRATAAGEWTAIPFNAGDFTGSGSMTWTVESGDVVTLRYTLLGKTVLIDFAIEGTTVGGTPDTSLLVALPAGLVPATSFHSACVVSDDGTRTYGLAWVGVGVPTLIIERGDHGNWSAATNATSAWGQLKFEIE